MAASFARFHQVRRYFLEVLPAGGVSGLEPLFVRLGSQLALITSGDGA
jgi:hypothetical protein